MNVTVGGKFIQLPTSSDKIRMLMEAFGHAI